MATQAEIDLKTTDPLTDGEIDRVREILGFDATADSSIDTDLIDRIGDLAGEKRQRLKAYIDDWDAISPVPVERRGGPKGTIYSTDKHEDRARNRTRALLGYSVPSTSSSGIRRISVGYPGSMCPVESDLQ